MAIDLVNTRVIVTGGRGLVGSAFVEYLKGIGNKTYFAPSSSELDLCDFAATQKAFQQFKPDYVFHFAGFVYGIGGNMAHKGMSYLKNVLINTHTVEASRLAGVKKMIAMGSGCVYGHDVPQPMRVENIWNGPPHFSEDSYAHAKRGMLA
ncbi:MAG TPA: NAD-dependent epimerase/dehydratase family protein, partial [Alphaproteobacteria bacterium]|nr:NAD-dependent epimerase/dehydratase family protein [Alphaproteobacteria bacterium]